MVFQRVLWKMGYVEVGNEDCVQVSRGPTQHSTFFQKPSGGTVSVTISQRETLRENQPAARVFVTQFVLTLTVSVPCFV